MAIIKKGGYRPPKGPINNTPPSQRGSMCSNPSVSCTVVTVCEGGRDKKRQKNYQEQAIRLVKSLRANGGDCSLFKVVVWTSNDFPASTSILNQLEKLGCEIIYGDCEYPQYPIFNKITALNNTFDTDYVLWLDTDIYINNNFLGLFSGDFDIAAPDVCKSHHKWARKEDNFLWEKLYSMIGVDYPGPRVVTCIDGKESNFYLCSGLILFKNYLGFAEEYRKVANRIIASNIPTSLQSFSQTSLSLTVLKMNLEYKIVPEKYHLVYALRKKIFTDTKIIHYQDAHLQEVKLDL